jgi:hypothetical protein
MARIYMRQGLPAFTELPTLEDVLGQVLMERGLIDQQTYNESLQRLSMGGKLHGQILREMGAITEAQLVDALCLQLRRKLQPTLLLPTANAICRLQRRAPLRKPRRSSICARRPAQYHLPGRAKRLFSRVAHCRARKATRRDHSASSGVRPHTGAFWIWRRRAGDHCGFDAGCRADGAPFAHQQSRDNRNPNACL